MENNNGGSVIDRINSKLITTYRSVKPNLGKLFNLKMVLDILAEYDIIHYDFDLSEIIDEKLYGFVDFENKKIYISTKQSKTDMIDTLVHELLHVVEDKLCEKVDEDNVSTHTHKILKKLFKSDKNEPKRRRQKNN